MGIDRCMNHPPQFTVTPRDDTLDRNACRIPGIWVTLQQVLEMDD
jgi:hypothetical protein